MPQTKSQCTDAIYTLSPKRIEAWHSAGVHLLIGASNPAVKMTGYTVSLLDPAGMIYFGKTFSLGSAFFGAARVIFIEAELLACGDLQNQMKLGTATAAG